MAERNTKLVIKKGRERSFLPRVQDPQGVEGLYSGSAFAVIGERAARYGWHAGWLKMMADVAEKLSLSDFSLLVWRMACL
ncbi:uncharacterized protein ARMOST_19293 [Armillaria ostoyae]|uniref:Uncharacterized protein n=1 Tax=Armillaria ostoyae TaxID=47428 RepID=A0A284S448_ARMOS|nr:uncharacterized protein ARMOST_19293 [Armillaria ostoyae]